MFMVKLNHRLRLESLKDSFFTIFVMHSYKLLVKSYDMHAYHRIPCMHGVYVQPDNSHININKKNRRHLPRHSYTYTHTDTQ